MTRSATLHDRRQRSAVQAFHSLGPRPSDHLLLAVQCAKAHHVANVYRTPSGPLFVSHPRPRAHGARDRHDAAHHGGHRDTPWLDWLGAYEGVTPDSPLPAGCECGPRSLSRAILQQTITEGTKKLVID